MKMKSFTMAVFSVILLLITMYFATAGISTSPIPDQTWQEDNQATLSLASYFPSGVTNYQAVSQPANIFVSTNPNTGNVTLTPEPNFNGVRVVQFSAINSSNATQSFYSNNVTLTVLAVPDTPTITSGAITSAEPNTLYQYQVTASDPDAGTTLSYALATAPSGMTISSSLGLISWTPASTGSFPVNVTVTDGIFTASQSFSIHVDYSGKLKFDNIRVFVDGSSQSGLSDGSTVSKQLRPGSTVKVEIKTKNTYTRTENIDINDVTIDATISGIDDGSDLDDSSDSFDLSADRTKTVTFTFNVPDQVDEGDYDLDLQAEGYDENGRTQTASAIITLSVNKQSHDLQITQMSLGSTVLSCQKTTTLNVEITNQGSEDEDRAAIEVIGSQFGFNQKDTDIELYSGTGDDSRFRKTYLINAANLPTGVYTIEVKTFYDDTRLQDDQTLTFSVEPCTTTTTNNGGNTGTGSTGSGNTGTGTTGGQGSTGSGLQVTYVTQPTSGGVTATAPAAAAQSGILSDDIFLPVIIIVGIIIILVLIAFIVKMLVVRN